MFRIFHLRGHKCQFPSLSLAFSPARPALSTVSDLTRPFYFPSRCQSPLGFSSVVDHLKSQSWILQICPANQHHSKAPICGLCSYCRSGGLSWGKATLPRGPECRPQVSSLCQAFRASSQGFTSLGQFSFPHPFHQHSNHLWLSPSSIFEVYPQSDVRLFFLLPHWNNQSP